MAGPLCVATLTLQGMRSDQKRASIEWRQTIGAATTIAEPPELIGGGRRGAQRGILALSPAADSSLWPLLRATPGRPSLTLAVRARRLLIGNSRGVGRTLRLGPTALDEALARGASSGRCAIGWLPHHWYFQLASVQVASVPPGGEMVTLVEPIPGAAVAQLDSGATHIVAPQGAREALLRASTSPSSLATALRGANASAPPRRLLLPLSHGCGLKLGSLTQCLRETAVPLLASRHGVGVWVFGLPFFRHHDVTMRWGGQHGESGLALEVVLRPSSSHARGLPRDADSGGGTLR